MAYLILLIIMVATGSPDDVIATVTFPDGTQINCELADTPSLRATGLSKHTSLAQDAGMLFLYPDPRLTSFWMPPEMKFEIDIIFMDENQKIIHIAHRAVPCKDPKGWDCESYSPEKSVQYVLETAAGIAKKHNLGNGDILKIELPEKYIFPTR